MALSSEKKPLLLTRKTLYVKPFWKQFEKERENQREREEKKWFQQGMKQSTTPL
jgi:hypothetical protein